MPAWRSALRAQYTVTRTYWWFSQTIRLDYTHDPRFVQQKALISALQGKVTQADAFADAAEAQFGKLGAQRAGYEVQRAAAEAKVGPLRAEYEMLTDRINGQFAVLKELSKFAIEVLKESRPGQSAAGWVDAGSLISELQDFSDVYTVLPDGSPANPFDRSEFLPGQSANSIILSEEHVRYAPILSVGGFPVAIHVGHADVENLTVKLGSGADHVQALDSLAAAGTVQVLTGGGDDVIEVGDDGSLDDIDGELVIDAQGGDAQRAADRRFCRS